MLWPPDHKHFHESFKLDMPNRLANETSPYLLQHANNPVDWYPWSPEALDRAKRENKPILLSIGYAACHWCHVMEHESFEDPATAAVMNEHFVNIKVDREERPDIDGIYMQAVQAMTGHGGWPMTMFLTPDGVPFYGGTYYPKEDRHGMPSFRRILATISTAYANKPEDIQRTATSVLEMYSSAMGVRRGAMGVNTTVSELPSVLERAYQVLAQHYDEEHGGISGAPKFPQTMSLDFLLRYSARRGTEQALSMVRDSFRHMARGGIYDQVGGGFARYAVDAIWLVPHFEKMLYDNALLVRLGAHLWQATRDEEVRRVTEETIDWALREMLSPDGAFYSSYDADSEGHEGKFYVWSVEEFDSLLGPDAEAMRRYWGVTEGGNFEGANILNVVNPRAADEATVARAKMVLYDARAKRVWPGLDDKVLASWNGLMVRGIAEAARAFGNDAYRDAAVRAATALFDSLVSDGRVLRSSKNGRKIAGYLEDHASLGLAALAVYEITFDESWLDRARLLGESVVRWFWDDDVGAFFDTSSDHETLITRPREIADNATPSGTALAVDLLLRLAEVFGDDDARRRATGVLESLAPAIAQYPTAFGHLLGCADMVVNGATELALIGDVGSVEFKALERAAGEEYVPSLVVAGARANEKIALLTGREMRDGKATAYVCRNYACEEPVTSAAQLREQLSSR
jgi:uncharacterized protein